MGIRHLLVIAAAAIGSAECYAYRPASLAPLSGATVRIVLRSPMTITTAAPDTERAHRHYDQVLEASGRIAAVAADTIALRLGELRTPAGSVPGVAREVALVPTAGIATIEERHFQLGRTVAVGVGVSALALTTLLVVLIVALTKAAA